MIKNISICYINTTQIAIFFFKAAFDCQRLSRRRSVVAEHDVEGAGEVVGQWTAGALVHHGQQEGQQQQGQQQELQRKSHATYTVQEAETTVRLQNTQPQMLSHVEWLYYKTLSYYRSVHSGGHQITVLLHTNTAGVSTQLHVSNCVNHARFTAVTAQLCCSKSLNPTEMTLITYHCQCTLPLMQHPKL